MTNLHLPLRPGRIEDAPVLAELVNHAGEGMPLYLWQKMAEPDQSAWDVGVARAARTEGAFSYRNAIMIERDGAAAGCLIGYEIPADPNPVPNDMPAMFRPLQELENLAPDSWYVNVLAVLPDHRGTGLGTRLLDAAERIGLAAGRRGMSVIVSDANPGARRLYETCSYRLKATRPMVKDDWVNKGSAWELLIKDF